MYKHILLFSSFIALSISAMAQSFSFSKNENGFAYNSKGECLLLTDSKDASIVLSSKTPSIFNCKCYEISFLETEDDIKIDSTAISKSKISVSSDSLSVTIKKIKANTGYLVVYGDSSCDVDQPCHAFTWVTEYLPIESVSWDKDTVICSDLQLNISPVMTYRSEYGKEQKVRRSLRLKYNNFLSDDNGGTLIDEVTEEYSGTSSIFLNTIPYIDTPFEVEDITSDNLSQKITTDTFYTQAVVAYPNIRTAAEKEHEGDEGTDTLLIFSQDLKEAISRSKSFRSSGPLTFNFTCNANDMSNHYEWAIANGTDANQGNFRNAFVLFEKNVNAYVVSDPDLY